MKTHPALAPLSRDHHHALVIARRLRHAAEQDADAATGAFLEHWEGKRTGRTQIERPRVGGVSP
jgi:hypothetical protein